MNIKELKEAIKNLPDDYEIFTEANNHYNSPQDRKIIKKVETTYRKYIIIGDFTLENLRLNMREILNEQILFNK
jgi:hypothetical protein